MKQASADGETGTPLMQNRVFPIEQQKRLPAPRSPFQPAGWMHSGIERVESFIANHPTAALAVGLTLGVTLGWLIKRKT